MRHKIEKDYNNEPVYYCKHCLSLKIMTFGNGSDICYCDKCGSTDIDCCNIRTWQLLVEEQHK